VISPGNRAFQEIMLHQKDSIFSNGQISCESGVAGRHLPAQEDQLRGGAHVVVCLLAIQIIMAHLITENIAYHWSSRQGCESRGV